MLSICLYRNLAKEICMKFAENDKKSFWFTTGMCASKDYSIVQTTFDTLYEDFYEELNVFLTFSVLDSHTVESNPTERKQMYCIKVEIDVDNYYPH